MAATMVQIQEREAELQRLQDKLRNGDKKAYKTMKVVKKVLFAMKHGEVLEEEEAR